MPERITFRFNHCLYKWEIGFDFVTIYDDIRYKHPKYPSKASLLDFLCTEKKIIIFEKGWYYHYKNVRNNLRMRSPIALNTHADYREDIQIVNSHEKNLAYFHSFSSYGFFTYPKPHCHIKFDREMTITEMNLIMEWMAEYTNEEITSLRKTFLPMLNYFNKKMNTIELEEFNRSLPSLS